MDLKAKLEKEASKTGEVNLNAGTIAQALTGEAAKTAEPKKDMMAETSEVKLSDKVKNDPVLKAAADGAVSEAMTQEMVKGKAAAEVQNKMIIDLLNTDDTVEITPNDKHLFLDAVIENKRFVLPFSLFAGRYTGEFRSRTQAETFAIFQQLNKELRQGGLESQLSYSMRLRNMLFATQVKRLNDKEYVELSAPLLTTVDGDKITPPAWLGQIEPWNTMNDGVINLIYNELRKFEYKYLMMLDNADNQNFWKAELPI